MGRYSNGGGRSLLDWLASPDAITAIESVSLPNNPV